MLVPRHGACSPFLLTLALVAIATGSATAAPSGPGAFTNAWEGRRLVLTPTLCSLVFDERVGALPSIKRRAASGLPDRDPATTVAVKCPVPFSKDLTESTLIVGVLNRFLTRAE